MKLVIQIKLVPTPEQAESLLLTMRAMNSASNYAAKIAFENKVFGQVPIHQLCYKELREKFGIGAQMAVRAIGKVVGAFARDRRACPEFSPLGAVQVDSRLYRLIGIQQASLSTVVGREKMPIVVGDYFKPSLNRKMGQADLVYRDGQFFLMVSVEFEEPPPVEPKDFLGIDLGIINLATTSEGEAFTGKDFDSNRKRRARARQTYQRRNTRNSKRRLRRMSGRQRRYQRDVNHQISKKIVGQAKALNLGIALEDLKGIRKVEKTVSRPVRTRISNWAFAQLRFYIEYKARLAGVPVQYVNPAHTSTTCSQCGCCEKANRKGQVFACTQCNFSCPADKNGALNIRSKALAVTVNHRDLASACGPDASRLL